MNLEMKIKKLSAAVVDYRGKRKGVGGPWIVRPLPGARGRVEKWLLELGRVSSVDLPRIDGFGDVREFWAFLGEVRESAGHAAPGGPGVLVRDLATGRILQGPDVDQNATNTLVGGFV